MRQALRGGHEGGQPDLLDYDSDYETVVEKQLRENLVDEAATGTGKATV